MRFSIIIPAYDVDKKLFEICLSSILKEQEVTYEIIIIDDGSDITFANLCDDYAKKNANIRVIHKINEGVSVARNCGIDNAKGDWILFVDADDWIEEGALKRIESIILQTDVDSIFFGYYKNFPKRELKITSATYSDGDIISTDEEKLLLQKKTIGASEYGEAGARATIFRSVWSVTFKRGRLLSDSIYFVKGVPIGEDLIFRLYTSRAAKKIQYSDYCYYHYRNNLESASCKYRKTAEEDSLKELSEIHKFIDLNGLKELDEAYRFRVVEVMTVLPKRCYFHKDNADSYPEKNRKARIFMQSDIVNDNVTKQVIKKLPLKRKIQVFLLRNNMFILYNLINKGNKKLRRLG